MKKLMVCAAVLAAVLFFGSAAKAGCNGNFVVGVGGNVSFVPAFNSGGVIVANNGCNGGFNNNFGFAAVQTPFFGNSAVVVNGGGFFNRTRVAVVNGNFGRANVIVRNGRRVIVR